MATPVVVVPSGGFPVTESISGIGLPVTVVTAYGRPVTQVPSGGFPVVGMDTGSSVGPNYRMRALTGSFFFSGDSMTIQAGYSMTAQVGAFALAGQNATLIPPAPAYTGPGDVTGWGTANGYWGLRGYDSTKLSGTTKCLDVASNASGAALNLTTVFIGSNGYVDLSGIGFSPIYVNRIYDQIGSQDLFQQGSRSQLITNAVGGKPSISFTTTEYYCSTANAVALAQPISMGTVLQTSGTTGIVLTDGSFNFQSIIFSTGALRQYFGAGPFDYTTFATNTLSSVISVANGATCTMWLNGAVMSPTTRNHGTNGIGTTNKLTIGGTDGGASLWTGHLYEFIIKSGVVSDADKTALSVNQHAIGTGW